MQIWLRFGLLLSKNKSVTPYGFANKILLINILPTFSSKSTSSSMHIMATYMKLVSYLLDTKTQLILQLYRCTTISSTGKPKQISPINQHHYIHFKITDHNIESFHISHSYFSSPLTYLLPSKDTTRLTKEISYLAHKVKHSRLNETTWNTPTL